MKQTFYHNFSKNSRLAEQRLILRNPESPRNNHKLTSSQETTGFEKEIPAKNEHALKKQERKEQRERLETFSRAYEQMSTTTLLAVSQSLTIEYEREDETVKSPQPNRLALAREELARKRHYERKSKEVLQKRLQRTQQKLKATSEEQQHVLKEYEHPAPFTNRDKQTERVLEQRLSYLHMEKHRLINEVGVIEQFLNK